MERLGIVQAASFDNNFAIYRFGRSRDKAFDIVRWGHSPMFRIFHRAILTRQQVTLRYKGALREVCPYILGHKRDGRRYSCINLLAEAVAADRYRRRGFYLSDVESASLRKGPWHGGASHRKTQRCVDVLYVDANTDVPNQPGRQPGVLERLEE
jgi:uncharacterized protein